MDDGLLPWSVADNNIAFVHLYVVRGRGPAVIDCLFDRCFQFAALSVPLSRSKVDPGRSDYFLVAGKCQLD